MQWSKILGGVLLVVVGIGLGVAGVFVPERRIELLITGGVLALVGAFNYFLFRYLGPIMKDFPGGKMSRGDMMKDGVKRMNAMAELLRQQTASQALQMKGRDAKAEVLAVRDTGQLVNFDPILEIDLVVSDGERKPYRMTCRQVVSKLALGRIATGQTFPARVDPENVDRIYVAWL